LDATGLIRACTTMTKTNGALCLCIIAHLEEFNAMKLVLWLSAKAGGVETGAPLDVRNERPTLRVLTFSIRS
jgi:hypothetical protein